MRKTELKIINGKLSNVQADAYLLPFLPYHECPTGVRYEVAAGGALGLRDFIDLRLKARHLAYGDAFFFDSKGGNAKMLIAVICRHPECNEEDMLKAIKRGFIAALCKAEKYNIKHIAMSPLCCMDGLDIVTFAKSLEIMIENGLEHGIEKITIATDDKETVTKLYHILE